MIFIYLISAYLGSDLLKSIDLQASLQCGVDDEFFEFRISFNGLFKRTQFLLNRVQGLGFGRSGVQGCRISTLQAKNLNWRLYHLSSSGRSGQGTHLKTLRNSIYHCYTKSNRIRFTKYSPAY